MSSRASWLIARRSGGAITPFVAVGHLVRQNRYRPLKTRIRGSVALVRTPAGAANYASPEDLYRDLPRRPGAVPGLWSHQADTLRDYALHVGDEDVALELPTGTGKTLTGLLIAEWSRRTRSERVLYACPTKQLARQVAASAFKEGLDVSLLIGKHASWEPSAQDAYESARAIGVTTYSSIFNSHPHLAEPGLVLFDDAHAGEQYVGEQFAVTLKRRVKQGGSWVQSDSYLDVLNAVASGLDGVFIDRLRADQPDPSINDVVRLVVPLRQEGMVSDLSAALGRLDGPERFSYSMIQGGLASCLVYVAYSGILVRPFIPPTYQNTVFRNARQRIYLSATLGNGGELERAFGRTNINRLALPDGSAAPRYGRRFFVFPELVNDVDSLTLATGVVREAGKALVLAPQTERAMAEAVELAPTGWPILGIDDVEDNMQPFAALDHAVCGLAGRYDGIDLPGDACRLVVLAGLPDQDSLQERFLAGRARASIILAERVRTRIIQGAGRCTRGPGDTAIVLIRDASLSRYLGRPETLSALDSELQAEIRFGRENSQAATTEADVLDNIEIFLNQATDDQWRSLAEPALADYRRDMPQRVAAGAAALASAVDQEVRAWAAAASGAWSIAAAQAQEAARFIGAGGADAKGYRAFWLYLAGVWLDQAAESSGDTSGRASADSLVRQAEATMGLGSWVREMAPFPAMAPSALGPADAFAVAAIADRLAQGVNQGTHSRTTGEMNAGLLETDPGSYEPALTRLGTLLGASASKPAGTSRCDSVWCWGNELWLALEAKSDHQPTGVVAPKDVRQANDQLRLLATDRSISSPPVGSATILVSPKPGIHDDGVAGAEPHVHFVAPPLVRELAYDASSAWADILARQAGLTVPQLRDLVATSMRQRAVLPSQVLERLTREPINGMAAQ